MVEGYMLQPGSPLDRATLVKFMQLTYAELFPGCGLDHLAQTVAHYFSAETPLWWVWYEGRRVACLWAGVAIDQSAGIRHAHVFLVYVEPEHRRRGIARSLMQVAEDWASARGDRQIGLQVFVSNQPAMNLYERLGYGVQAVAMMKYWGEVPDSDVER
jgi:ribosomal protein S18 acetylase RimI-like enzyme